MKKKKRILSIILCIAMCLVLFVGCSSEDVDPSGGASNDGIGGDTPEKTNDDISNEDIEGTTKLTGKIVVGGWPAGDDAFEAVIPLFKEKHPDVEIELSFQQGNDYNQMLTTALAAGTGAPDVAMMEQAWVGRYRDSTEFENLLEAPYNASDMKDDFVEYKWNLATSVDGTRLVGLVWDIGPASMFYRRDVFEDAGLPSEPEEVEELMSTWDGVLEAAEAIHIPNQRWLFPNAANMFTWNYMNRDFYNEKLELRLDKPGAREALEAAIKMREKGLDAQYIQSSETEPALAEGKLGAHVSGCWYGGFLKSWIAPDTSGLWGITRLPGGIADSNWGGSYVGIPSQSENKDAAWEFILFTMATKEGQNTMFKAVDYFPGYIPAWDDPLYEEEDPFFGGQKTRALWVDISKSLEPTFSTLMDATTESIINNVVNTGLNEGKSADAIIEDVIQEVKEGTKQDYQTNMDLLKDAGLID